MDDDVYGSDWLVGISGRFCVVIGRGKSKEEEVDKRMRDGIMVGCASKKIEGRRGSDPMDMCIDSKKPF